MDPSEQRPSPRREGQLQGPRPSPLRVSRDSHKIRKPPLAPAAGPSQPYPQQPPPEQQQHREPVIIYTVSPKVIHTEPCNFMTLVQRLTGASPTTLAAAAAARHPLAADQPGCPSPGAAAALFPAARFAAIERAQPSSDAGRAVIPNRQGDIVDQLGIGSAAALDRSTGFPGILSPLPSALPPISPNFFSPLPAVDPSSLAFLNEMSPLFRANTSNNFMEAPFLPSPGNFLSTPTLPSPSTYWEFFSQL